MNEMSRKENRLLVVDDDLAICDILRDLGESCDYATLTTPQAREFQRLYGEFDPTIIMLDLSIGEQDGVELLRFLSSRACKCPIVMMSGGR